ncbi:MAG: acyl-CoA reductase [Bacteroidota bacterium]
MITLEQRIKAFTELGHILTDAASPQPSLPEATAFRKLMDRQVNNNKWFTPANVKLAVEAIGKMLREDRLREWIKKYTIADDPAKEKTIAVIMAGNIPLVGFHDFLCVLMSGQKILARSSSKDSELIRAVADLLAGIENAFSEKICFTEKINSSYDAVIATGSDNTSRYFGYYFGHKPHIFRKNRNSVAIIGRNTSKEDIQKLGSDIFSYFGLGCRSVSKIFIQEGVDPAGIFAEWEDWSSLTDHRPYANNYLYNKSLFNLNKQSFMDSGFMLFKNDTALSSPVAVTYYEFFSERQQLLNVLQEREGMIQCIVSENDILFGQTQYPGPGDYADNMDTIEFINSL